MTLFIQLHLTNNNLQQTWTYPFHHLQQVLTQKRKIRRNTLKTLVVSYKITKDMDHPFTKFRETTYPKRWYELNCRDNTFELILNFPRSKVISYGMLIKWPQPENIYEAQKDKTRTQKNTILNQNLIGAGTATWDIANSNQNKDMWLQICYKLLTRFKNVPYKTKDDHGGKTTIWRNFWTSCSRENRHR